MNTLEKLARGRTEIINLVREREREILLHFRFRARWQAGGSRIYLNLESSILLNPSCYYTFGVATF